MPAPSKGSTTPFLKRGVDYFGMSGAVEFCSAISLFAVLIALLIVNVLHYSFDSDEPQHLHVIWGWTHGLLQYRDTFDNHMPLFQIALAPIFVLIGERATVLYWMRFILLPTFFISAWCTYQIGTRLFSRRTGAWSVVLLGLCATYHFHSLEFRTDNLWVAFWLLCVVVLLGGNLSPRRALVAGLLLSFCFGVSLKSTLFLISLAVATASCLAIAGPGQWRKCRKDILRSGAVFLVGSAIVPATIAIFFASKGLWPEFRYDVLDFNLLSSQLYEKHLAWAPIVAFPFVLLIACQLIRSSRDPGVGWRRAFLLIVCGAFFLFLQNFWRSITYQDYLPIYPVEAVLAAGGLIAASNALAERRLSIFHALPLPIFVAIIELVALVRLQPLWKDDTRDHTALLRDVLSLTNRDDYILDCKGETVFRQRALHLVLEKITQHAIEQGLLIDDAPQRCIATHTCVAVTIIEERFSAGTLHFIEENYLPITKNLRVAGVALKPSAEDATRSEFDVVIPASYKLVSRDGNVSGSLDGAPYEGARFLTPGQHVFQSRAPLENVVLLWAQAVDRRFTPFGHL
jgi:hypothetical protein